MDTRAFGRRHFLTSVGLLSAGATLAAAARPAYDPAARVGISVTQVPMRKNAAGPMLMARVYRPEGPGLFPTVLDLHGSAWNAKDRFAEEPMDRAIASSGVLVVAIDLTLAKEAPYPASVQDANYGVRWLKWKAPTWGGDASRIGIYGSSSGGHVAELLSMRPRDPRYNAIRLDEAPGLDATVANVATRSPISDPLARFKNAEAHKRTDMMENHDTYFKPWESIVESNPQQIARARWSSSSSPIEFGSETSPHPRPTAWAAGAWPQRLTTVNRSV